MTTMSRKAITRNDTITVTAGDYAGESGLVVCIFRGMATVARDDDRWFTVPIGECEKEKETGRRQAIQSQ